MRICCLDLEGVLVPEIWIRVAEKTKIEELRVTTREIKDYDELMAFRLNILNKNKITIHDIQSVIATIKPLTGAKKFLDDLREQVQVIILSDTFNQFAAPLMKQLDYPTLFCHDLEINKKGMITDYLLRQKNQKEKAVKALKKLNFEIYAAGDSYNDISMLKAADKGIFFNAPDSIKAEFPKLLVSTTYKDLTKKLLS